GTSMTVASRQRRWPSRAFDLFRSPFDSFRRRRDQSRQRSDTHVRPRLAALEDRWVPAATITINGSVTLDESPGLQNTGSPAGAEDNNDSDVALATLQSGAATFYNRLFNSAASGGLGLSTTFATTNGVAQSASNFITVTGGGTVTSLGFVKD